MTKKDIVYHNGRKYKVPCEISEYIDELETSVQQLKHDYTKIESELNCLKPIIPEKELPRAYSNRCRTCKFVVVSPWDSEPLYCLKDAVCESYERNE